MRKKEPQWLIIPVFWLRTIGRILISDIEDIEPLVNYLGETKVNFESDVCQASPSWHLEIPDIKAIKHTLIKT